MKTESNLLFNKQLRTLIVALLLPCLLLMSLLITRLTKADVSDETPVLRSLSPLSDPNFPRELDVRGFEGIPHLDFKGEGIAQNAIFSLRPSSAQLRSLNVLRTSLGLQNLNSGVIFQPNDQLQVQYNGLTATPRFLFVRGGYLTNSSSLQPEVIARNFIRTYSTIFKFSQEDLDNLKLKSRAVTQEGTTILLFEQQANGLPLYHGEVLVNVNAAGRILSVGGDSFPQLSIGNSQILSSADAITKAAEGLKLYGFAPQFLGKTKVLNAYGDLPQTFVDGDKYSKGNVFSDDIVVEKVVFPVGNTGRIAYKFTLTTPQYFGMMWQNIVDAETGAILRRASLTAFDTGGGVGVGRKTTFRPDIQDSIEAANPAGTAKGKVVDSLPSTFSAVGGAGRPVKNGNNYSGPSIYQPSAGTNRFTFALTSARNENPLPFADTAVNFTQAQLPSLNSQVTHNFPDALNPSLSSPYGWFYLPTGTGGTEITATTASSGSTRAYGYMIDSAADTATSRSAKSRNTAIGNNSPTGDGNQPFSATLTTLPSSVTLADGRVLSRVYQSDYTEGNNVSVSDDRANDNDATRGVRGYSATRDFTPSRFDYFDAYEFGGTDASGGGTGATAPVTYPASSDPDVVPGDVALFNYNNIEHDYLYSIGFTEPLWNFQQDNFGKGGAPNDAIVAEVEDGSGTDNANMGTPAEGGSPRMQMYFFTDGGLRRSDGDFDFDVIGHEHYHGVSNRSAGKGDVGCLGITLVGESGGMGEGWSDAISTSMTDDDNEGEYVTGNMVNGIRRLAYTNYRYSYGSFNGNLLTTRKNVNTDVTIPVDNAGGIPFEVHDIGEVWAATLWDMRELMIVKQKVGSLYPGIFFDGNRRTGTSTSFFIGDRPVRSVDTNHPINYRSVAAFTAQPATVRPGMLASEIQSVGNRSGNLAKAVRQGATLADKIVLRGLQLAPCNPTFVDMRDSMLLADTEITGGENQAIIWRSFTSHGVGTLATSTGGTNDGTGAGQSVPIVVEDYTVPTDVTTCETLGPLAAPFFTVTDSPNAATVTITNVVGAASYVIQRSTNPNGPFTTVATVAQGTPTNTTYTDSNLNKGTTYYYVVHTARSANCVGYAGNAKSILINNGTAVMPIPVFVGVSQVQDSGRCSQLNLSWSPASSTNPNATIVYDIFRSETATANDGTAAVSFVPATPTKTVTSTSFTDSGLMTGKIYYYIVRARDTNNGKSDTNTVVKFNAPTSASVGASPFVKDDFETAGNDTRFTPALIASTAPNQALSVFQKVSGVDLGNGALTSVMYAPDFDPAAGMGGPSNFVTSIGPITPLTQGSFLEFDHKFSAENAFDGGILELSLGAPETNATLTQAANNVTSFDLGDFIVQNGYTGQLNGELVGGVPLNQFAPNRFAFTGTKGLSHVRVALGDFRPAGSKNPNSLPVYINFRMTSDAGSTAGDLNAGWYIDSVAVNNFTQCLTTAAGVSVSGRVTNPAGRGLARVRVALQTANGEIRFATTNIKGVYKFDDVQANSTVVITPSLKGYDFGTEALNITEERSDINFVAQPRSTSSISQR